MRRNAGRLAFWAVVGLAAFLRFAGLPRASFFHYDEGETAKSALGPAVAVRWALAAAWQGESWGAQSLKAEYRQHGFPYARTSARPGFLGLSALSMALWGVSDLAVIGVSAFLGTLTVALLFASLRRCDPDGGEALPFWGSLALAVWPTHVFFSRTGFAHVSAGFFLMLAFHLHVRGVSRRGRRPAFGAGLACGMAFACHFNVAWALAVLAICHVLLFRREGTAPRRGACTREIVAGLSGAACPVVFFQLATVLAREAFPRWLPDQRTYFEDLRAQWAHLLHYCNPRAEASPFFYLIHEIRTETPGVIGGIVAGTCLLFLRPSLGEPDSARRTLWFAGALFWVPFAAASAMSWKVARTLVPMIPFGAVLWGVFLARLPWPRARAWVGAVLLAAPLAVSAGYLAGHGHFRGIAEDARRRGMTPAGIDEFPALDFYARYPGAVLPRSRADVEAARVGRGKDVLFVALWRDGRYGFDDPVYAGRFRFLADLAASGARPTRVMPFAVPLAYEHVDASWSWEDLFSIAEKPYAVHLFDLREGTR